MIYHITTRSEWETAQQIGYYTAPSLQKEGFIHNSTAAQIVRVSNAFYRDVLDCVLLYIDESQVTAPIKWEAPAHPDPAKAPSVEPNDLFPHIYGRLNVDAVVKVVSFAPGADGKYTLPADIRG